MTRAAFWNKKKVLVTGHTGFKGGWLSTWLLDLGADVVGYALEPDSEPCFFTLCGLSQRMESVFGDVRSKEGVQRIVDIHNPEIVFHLAAQPLVRYSYNEPVDTFATNVMGTVHLLEAVRQSPSVHAAIIVTSDKCYENKEWIWGYREEERIGGRDPYSASKACAELVTASYRRSWFENPGFNVGIATVRAGNVIGGGDWGRDRLVPDAVRAFRSDQPLIVRNPASVRPWQHVLEPLAGYLMLAEKLYQEEKEWSGAWNFGPGDESVVTVASLCDLIISNWHQGRWQPSPPQEDFHEASFLLLDSSKARRMLGWRPCLSLEEAVNMTVEWYCQALSNGQRKQMYGVTCDQIRSYEKRWKEVTWR
ncbi:MAG: CDP-glucose 4,6-dehydratase [Ignavibacteriae bacterium]|nr:CDP-glucose 4,6-dehydratase [Ignavibacteriota bacterium]